MLRSQLLIAINHMIQHKLVASQNLNNNAHLISSTTISILLVQFKINSVSTHLTSINTHLTSVSTHLTSNTLIISVRGILSILHPFDILLKVRNLIIVRVSFTRYPVGMNTLTISNTTGHSNKPHINQICNNMISNPIEVKDRCQINIIAVVSIKDQLGIKIRVKISINLVILISNICSQYNKISQDVTQTVSIISCIEHHHQLVFTFHSHLAIHMLLNLPSCHSLHNAVSTSSRYQGRAG